MWGSYLSMATPRSTDRNRPELGIFFFPSTYRPEAQLIYTSGPIYMYGHSSSLRKVACGLHHTMPLQIPSDRQSGH